MAAGRRSITLADDRPKSNDEPNVQNGSKHPRQRNYLPAAEISPVGLFMIIGLTEGLLRPLGFESVKGLSGPQGGACQNPRGPCGPWF